MRPAKPGSSTFFTAGAPVLLAGALFLTVGCTADDGREPAEASSATIYRGARVITGQPGPPIEDAVFVVDDGRFTAVGTSGDVEVPDGAAEVDLSGRTVIPALVNTHMHLASDREARIAELRHNAYYGAGVVTSLGLDEGEVAFEIRDHPVRGAALGLTAGRGITRPEPGRSQVPFWVDTPEEARQAVRELAADRVDLVKIWVDDRGGEYDKMTPELYGAAIDEAHEHGLKVTAHIFALDDAKGLLRAGVDAFAHSVRDRPVDEEFLGLVRERPDFFYVPNLPASGIDTELGWLSGTIPADELARLRDQPAPSAEAQERFEIQGGNLARLDEAGVTIGFGTDGGSPFAAHLEMEDMVAAGMAPADVLVAATGNSAAFLGLTDHGTIEVGKSADFVVLAANPLDDITNTRLIEAVHLRGETVDREAVSAAQLQEGGDGR